MKVRKSQARMQERAWIVLLTASGIGSRAIARAVDCTPGTASKWRVRFASPGRPEPSDGWTARNR
jgi:hypothetical protein